MTNQITKPETNALTLVSEPAKYSDFKQVVQLPIIQERFQQVLKDRYEVFLSALLSTVADNKTLQKCTSESILTAALKAAVLDLDIEPSLGQAYIVPFGKKATFIIGYRGLLQLGYRTNMYEAINATHVFEGEQVKENRLSGEIELSGSAENENIIGAAAYFRMKNGLEKVLYMDMTAILAHAERYSRAYQYDLKKGTKVSPWSTEPEKMYLKTVLRLLLSKWGLLSIRWSDADLSIDEKAVADHTRLMEETDQEFLESGFDSPDQEFIDAQTEFDMFGNMPDSEVEGETPIEDM